MKHDELLDRIFVLLQRATPVPLLVGAVAELCDEYAKGRQPSFGIAPLCPRGPGVMLLRTAVVGPTAGKQFWGCRAFPRCGFAFNYDQHVIDHQQVETPPPQPALSDEQKAELGKVTRFLGSLPQELPIRIAREGRERIHALARAFGKY